MFHPLEIPCMSETQIYQDCDIVSNLCNISVILGFWIFFLVHVQVSQGGIVQKDMEKSVCN